MAKNKKKEKTFMQKFIRRFSGLLLLLFCLFTVAACFFFDRNDASFNLISNAPVKNLLGLSGAKAADFTLTWFGFALPVFLIVPVLWGYSLLRLREIFHPYIRFFAWIFGLLLFSSFLGLLPQTWAAIPMGGSIGKFFAREFSTLLNRVYTYGFGRELLAFIFFALAWVSFNFAAGISFKSWYLVLKNIVLKIAAACLWIKEKLFSRRQSDTMPRPKKERLKKEAKNKKERIEPKINNEAPAPAPKSAPYRPEINDGYQTPSISLLSMPKEKSVHQSQSELDKIAGELEAVLQEFGVNGKIVKVRPGPVVTLYELEPAPGTKTARVIGLADDIARSMSARSVRIAVVTGSNTIGIEMPNIKRDTVWLRELLENDEFSQAKGALTITLGKDIGGKNMYADLSKMPHLLVAGTTGSGKSVGVNSMILSLLYKMRPDECKLIMIDPKMLEFSMYNGIPHLLTPVITDPAKAVIGLKWAVKEMEDRYRAMANLNVRNITGYNQRVAELKAGGQNVKRTVQVGFDTETGKPLYEEQEMDLTPLPYIVIVVDEMADLMLVAGKDVEAAIQRLAQMARAAGIHLIMSTQRPSVDVITGTIKANFPTRISFQVTSKIDSRTILGEQGAEQLLGMGDMLYMPAGQRPIRVHGSFVKDSEVEAVVEFLKSQKEPEYVEGVTEGELNAKDDKPVFDNGDFAAGSDEDLYNQAVAIVRNDKKASTSYVQRKLRIGYNRAASLIDRMESEGIISAADPVGRREVL